MSSKNIKILIFLQGTIIMHKNAQGKTREETIKQVKDKELSVRDFLNYIPIGNASEKLNKWVQQGAEICYLTSLSENKKVRGDETVGKEGLKADNVVLRKYNFPEGIIYHREINEDYKDVVARILPLPNIIIEDDCESIGGKKEMTFTYLKEDLKSKIKSIPVKEFGGIDYLPDDIYALV
jgi:hypothetical protein